MLDISVLVRPFAEAFRWLAGVPGCSKAKRYGSKSSHGRRSDATNGAPGIATNGARTLLEPPGLTTRSKTLLGAKGIATYGCVFQ